MFLKTCSRTLDQWQSFNATAEQKHVSNQKYFEIAKRTTVIPDSQFPPAETCRVLDNILVSGVEKTPTVSHNLAEHPFVASGPIWGSLQPIYCPNDPWVYGANLLSLLIERQNRGEKKKRSAHQPPPTGCNLTSSNSSNTVQEHNCVTDKTISTTIIWHHGNMGWSSKFQWQLLTLGCLVLGQSWL